MEKKYDALALFSGGLDSILAIKVVQAQGLEVLGLHFVGPFFGYPEKIPFWRKTFGVEVAAVPLGQAYVDDALLAPKRGYGKFVNPCIDCHAHMVRRALELLPHYGATFLISGEVVGQRPMSQRKDAMASVAKDAEAKGLLVRPLCAKHLEPTKPELEGILDRDKLLDMKGRGRKDQHKLAAQLGFAEKDLPTPAGGCMLTMAQPGARYLKLITAKARPAMEDFELASHGRMYWSGYWWLSVGRDKADNERLRQLVQPADLLFDVRDHAGPVAVGRPMPATPGGEPQPWPEHVAQDAAAFVASFSSKAKAAGGPVAVVAEQGGRRHTVQVTPARETPLGWTEPKWEYLKEEKKLLAAKAQAQG